MLLKNLKMAGGMEDILKIMKILLAFFHLILLKKFKIFNKKMMIKKRYKMIFNKKIMIKKRYKFKKNLKKQKQ